MPKSTSRRSQRRFCALDLFSGAGGFSLGLESTGIVSCGAIDTDEVAGKTYRWNFGKRPIHLFGKVGDVKNIPPSVVGEKLERAGIHELDVLVAGPPCQGFSRIGRGKLDSMAHQDGAFVLDPRNHLYRQAVAFLAALKPRVFLFENVAGILHVRQKNVAEAVCRAIEAQGYTVRAGLLNSAWYGVPQSRERLFIIGVREDLELEPHFPAREHRVIELTVGHLSEAELDAGIWQNAHYFVPFEMLPRTKRLRPAVTVREAFADLPPFTQHLQALRRGTEYRNRRAEVPVVPYRSGATTPFVRAMRTWPGLPISTVVSDHYCRWTPRDFETFARMRPDDRYADALRIAHERYAEARTAYEVGAAPFPRRSDFIPPYPADCFDEKWRKLRAARPAHTVTAHLAKDTYSHIHFDKRQARAVTPREAARLQTFPDGFRFAGNMGDVFRQIGNAVPPLMARAIGREIYRLLCEAEAKEERVCSDSRRHPRLVATR